MHKVGDIVWVFNQNRRVYRQENGRSVGGLIFRDHFIPEKIVGETERSWLVGRPERPIKIPKKGDAVRYSASTAYGRTTVYMTQEAVNAACFAHDHRWKIGKAVEACMDVAVLRQIAALVGYKAEE
jgi:hypothetical protein